MGGEWAKVGFNTTLTNVVFVWKTAWQYGPVPVVSAVGDRGKLGDIVDERAWSVGWTDCAGVLAKFGGMPPRIYINVGKLED